MSNHVTCERAEKQPAADCEYEADGLESSIHSSYIRVEYYRSFEYCVKRKFSMYPRCSSRPKASKRSARRSPSPSEDVIQRRTRGKRRRTGLRGTQADDDGVVDTDETKGRDIIDIIDIIDSSRVAREDEVEVRDDGVDDSDDDCGSVNSSIVSGPSLLRHSVSPKKRRPLRGLCLACKTLYQKARKMKRPIKNKLSDNDPKSLTCDQWVLIKRWRPRRRPNARGKLLSRVKMVKRRLAAKKGAKRPAQRAGEPPACSRPHTFLQRNLRRRVRAPVTKEKKRTRGGSQGRRGAKQQQQQQQQQQLDGDKRGHGGAHGFDGRGDQEVDGQADTNLTLEFIPSTIAVKTGKPRKVPPAKKAPKKTGGLRDLLAQLRGNSSVIVRETP